ncbi:MAG: DUF4139 domain-containing protein, partial [Myxococcales bacterium]|nr:DUF4139 domain-containing protein [Myxococcales bacterium]
RAADRPEAIAAVEARLRELEADLRRAADDGERAAERLASVARMLQLGAREIPEDAVWGTIDPALWSRTFDDLFSRGRELVDAALDAKFTQEDLVLEASRTEEQRAALAREDHDVACWALVDLELDAPASVELVVEYVVPNALWRPMHRAELRDGELVLTSRAAIWQHTGEDWTEVELSLSTAQGSLGTEPPQLADDLLSARRKPDNVELQAREVAVQSLGPSDKGGGGGGRPRSNALDLPGVDDGGEVQDLRPDGRITVQDGGRPVFVDLATTRSPAEIERVCMPELGPEVHLAVRADHTGAQPLLAGPVELVRDHGPVGSTAVLYVAPSARMELGFGPEDTLRVQRSMRVRKDERDPVDKWHRRDTEVSLFVSNLGGEDATVTITERIPVSEVEHVRIAVDGERTTPGYTLDTDNGFVRWTWPVAAHSTSTVLLDWQLALAPEAVMKR